MIHASEQNGRPLREVRVLLNETLDGRKACYVYYSVPDHAFLLVDDSGEQSIRAGGGKTVIENSQCSLDLAGSTAEGDSQRLTVHLALKFKPSFVGKKQVFLYTEATDGSNSGLTPQGTWSVMF